MKTKFTLMALLLAGIAVPSLQAQETEQFKCIADTWIQEGSTNKRGGHEQIETGANRGALFSFEFNLEKGKKVQSATLHLVSKLARQSKVEKHKVYAYSHDYDEANALWDTESEYYQAALSNDPIAEFEMAGSNGNSTFDHGKFNVDEYGSLDKWTNDIDVTSYVKTFSLQNRINFLVVYTNSQSRFYSKENKGETTAFDGATVLEASDLIPYLEVTFVEDADAESVVLEPSADTFVRSSASTNHYEENQNLEIYWLDNSEKGEPNVYFAGLMKFGLPYELTSGKYQLTGASLRLSTICVKSDRNMNFYPFGDFKENNTWNDLGDEVLQALKTDPFATISMNGNGATLGSNDKIPADYTNASAWTTNIDVTDYIKTLLEDNATDFSFLMCKKVAGNNAIRIASKETQSITSKTPDPNDPTGDTTISFTIDADDLKPLLTLAYSKISATEEIEHESVEEITAENKTTSHLHFSWAEQHTIKLNADNEAEIKARPATRAEGDAVTLSANVEENKLKVDVSELSAGSYTINIPAGYVTVGDNGINKEVNYPFTQADADYSGINDIEEAAVVYKVFNLQGINVLNSTDAADVKALPKGIYIVNGKKVVVK